MEDWWEVKDDESHHLEQNLSTNESELKRDSEIILIAERDRIKQEKDKKNKTFLVLAMLFYSLGYVVPLEVGGIFSEAGRGFCMMYMVAGTVCLYIQYLVSIGKVSFGESTSEIGHSGWDGSDWD
jgi:hypothetical protein|tara:strand:+ start:498 stop:872 length:375 start_codon:yes stop_codon:yes gene_type:complete